MTLDEFLAEQLKDPEYAAAHAVGRPFTNLALNVWSLRETKEMTQKQLAEAAKMKQPRIADIERDESNPTLLTISRIAFALGVTASDLLAEPDDTRLAKARALVEASAAKQTRRPRVAQRTEDATEVPEPAPRRRAIA
ncbi:helix-turn-helix domain-containing protein [Longimicrobium sp.]|uniref:helix-turn-helix domain-containing protein n=1 Tax=Longimicrobium sp. TaxID=2029185 RepID=UPI003B3AF0C4